MAEWKDTRIGQVLVLDSGLIIGEVNRGFSSVGWNASHRGKALGSYYTEAQAKAAVETKETEGLTPMTKILVDSELLEALAKCLDSAIDYSQRDFDHPPEPSTEWDLNAGVLVTELRAALDAPQQEAVAWQQSAAEVIASFVHLSANPNPDEWALVAVDAIRLLNIPPAHPAPSVPEEQNVPDTELPGMWEYADFSGGSTDSAAPKAPTADDRKDAEREGFYEKMWKDFVSLQRGDAKQICIDAERYRWIQENYTAYDNNYGHWCARLEYLPCADSLGEAIDAAIAAQKGEKE